MVTMTAPLPCTYIWLDVNDADLSAVQNIFRGLNTGAVQISSVLPMFQKPAKHMGGGVRLHLLPNEASNTEETSKDAPTHLFL